MQRTQIYLPEELRLQLKKRSRRESLSVSEIIRRALENDLQRDPASDARAFFAQLEPLESFAPAAIGSSPGAHVRSLRAKSRLLRADRRP